MIIGTELRAWMADAQRQRSAREAAGNFATAWNQGPIHRRLAEAMAGRSDDSAEAVAAAVRVPFTDDNWSRILIDSLAAEMRRDPFFVPPLRHLNSDIHSGLVIYEDDLASVALGVTSIVDLAAKKSGSWRAGSILFSGQVELFKFITGGAQLSFWRARTITEDFTAAHAGRCERTGEQRVSDGEILTVDGRSESFVIEHATASLVVLQASVKPERAPLSVEYDFATREYLGCSAADDSASRIQMLTTLLRKLDGAGAFAAVAEFIDHQDFFVRWHVMRELLGLDLDRAMPHLRAMAARDPHPETRQAARQVLDRLDQPAPRRAAA